MNGILTGLVSDTIGTWETATVSEVPVIVIKDNGKSVGMVRYDPVITLEEVTAITTMLAQAVGFNAQSIQAMGG